LTCEKWLELIIGNNGFIVKPQFQKLSQSDICRLDYFEIFKNKVPYFTKKHEFVK
jgi:hypothetical protein